MNTRGLMELIVLNMGYDLGILSPRDICDAGADGTSHHFYDRPFTGSYKAGRVQEGLACRDQLSSPV